MKRPRHQNSTPSWTNPLVKQGNIHLSFQKRWRKEHICISLGITLDCLSGSNNANSRCSFPLIKKLKPDGFIVFFFTYSEQRLCAKPTAEHRRFQHTKQGRKKSWVLLPCYISQVFVRGKGEGWGSGNSDTEGCHLKLWGPKHPQQEGKAHWCKVNL